MSWNLTGWIPYTRNLLVWYLPEWMHYVRNLPGRQHCKIIQAAEACFRMLPWTCMAALSCCWVGRSSSSCGASGDVMLLMRLGRCVSKSTAASDVDMSIIDSEMADISASWWLTSWAPSPTSEAQLSFATYQSEVNSATAPNKPLWHACWPGEMG